MNPKIGPSDTALTKHMNCIKQNMHHRWLAAQKMGLKDIPVEVMK